MEMLPMEEPAAVGASSKASPTATTSTDGTPGGPKDLKGALGY